MEPRWVLVDHAPRILGQTPERLAGFAARTLCRNGIEVVNGTALESVDATGAQLDDGRRIPTRTVVWTAGVSANPMAASLGLPVDDRGRVLVEPTLRGRRHARRLGARRRRRRPEHGDARRAGPADLPARAAPGPTCSPRNLTRHAGALRLQERAARWPRSGAATGSPSSGGLHVRGIAGWTFARAYHLLQLPFASRRLRVLGDWCTAALFPRDVSELTLSGERA